MPSSHAAAAAVAIAAAIAIAAAMPRCSLPSLPPLPPQPQRRLFDAWNTTLNPQLDITVVSVFSNGTCGTASCLVRHMKRMIRHDESSAVRYDVRLGFYSLSAARGATTGGTFKSAAWLRASKARIELLLQLLTTNARRDWKHNRLYLLSDLDVVALRPYSALAAHFLAREQGAAGHHKFPHEEGLATSLRQKKD